MRAPSAPSQAFGSNDLCTLPCCALEIRNCGESDRSINHCAHWVCTLLSVKPGLSMGFCCLFYRAKPDIPSCIVTSLFTKLGAISHAFMVCRISLPQPLSDICSHTQVCDMKILCYR